MKPSKIFKAYVFGVALFGALTTTATLADGVELTEGMRLTMQQLGATVAILPTSAGQVYAVNADGNVIAQCPAKSVKVCEGLTQGTLHILKNGVHLPKATSPGLGLLGSASSSRPTRRYCYTTTDGQRRCFEW